MSRGKFMWSFITLGIWGVVFCFGKGTAIPAKGGRTHGQGRDPEGYETVVLRPTITVAVRSAEWDGRGGDRRLHRFRRLAGTGWDFGIAMGCTTLPGVWPGGADGALRSWIAIIPLFSFAVDRR